MDGDDLSGGAEDLSPWSPPDVETPQIVGGASTTWSLKQRIGIVAGVALVAGGVAYGLLGRGSERGSESIVVVEDEVRPASTIEAQPPSSLLRPVAATSTSSTMASTTLSIDESASASPIDTVAGEAGGTAPPQDDAAPAVVARPTPVDPPAPPPEAPAPPWAASRITTGGGHVSTDVGCALDTSAAGLDAFFAERVGPVLGWDYQHVYDLGGGRQLWLFQDTFVDQSGTASTLDKASFIHNSAMVQEGACFRLLHRGTALRPTPFELGTGTTTLRTWFWPMGGEVHNGQLVVFWAEMVKDAVDPLPPDGLGWHPVATHIATYDPNTLARLDFRRAPNSGATPIYGYAVASDETHTYLFGNTFEQNMTREGGWFNGPHSGTLMFLARVPKGQLFSAPEYWRPEGWDPNPAGAQPFLRRHWAEFPMQPRYIGGQWAATTAVNGYWGEEYTVDVAPSPWGPWTTVESRVLLPRNFDPLMNTYHAHLHPQLDAFGNFVVSVSNNARDMLRHAWPNPARYRPIVFTSLFQRPPPVGATTTITTTTTSTTSTSTTVAPTTSTSTTLPPTTTSTTTLPPTTTSTSTTLPPTTTTTTSVPPTTTTTVPLTTTSTTTVPDGATTDE